MRDGAAAAAVRVEGLPQGPPSWRFSAGLVGIAAVLILVQDFSLITNPRLLAEEGTLFLSRAWAGPPLMGGHWADVGYLDLVPVLVINLAVRVLPLEHALYGLAFAAFLVHLLPAMLVARARSSVFAPPLHRTLAVLAIALAIPADETWLSTLASKFFLAAVPMLILMESEGPARSRRPPWHHFLFMFFCGLSSGVVLLVLPVVAWRAWRPGGSRFRLLGVAFLAGAALQVGVIVGCTPAATDSTLAPGSRLRILDPSVLAASALFDGILPRIVGPETSARAAAAFESICIGAGLPEAAPGIATVAAALALFFLLSGRGTPGSLASAWILLAGGSVAVSIVPGVGPLGSGFHSRYFIAPSLVFAWMLVTRFPRSFGELRRPRCLAAALLLPAMLLGGAAQWRPSGVEDRNRPRWSDEVAHWRADGDHQLRIVPPPWRVRLCQPDEVAAAVLDRPPAAVPSSLSLDATAPRLGDVVHVRITGAPPGARGRIFVRVGRPGPLREVPEASGVRMVLPLPPESGAAIDFVAGEDGSFAQDVPLLPHMHCVGLLMTAQAVVFAPAPLASNALLLRLGL